MSFSSNSAASRRRFLTVALAAASIVAWPLSAQADSQHVITVMTRNMDAGTDMNYILAASDPESFVAGMAATLAEIKESGFEQRAARLADEIAARKPDLIALQEVTLWRTGTMLAPPANDVLYDQLGLLMAELKKRNLEYEVVARQFLMDAEAPVPTEGIDLRITDSDVILVRSDLPRPQLRVSNAQVHQYRAKFAYGSPMLGELVVPRGWMSLDVNVLNKAFRFVNTHMESTYPGLPNGATTQLAQIDELMAELAGSTVPVILAGDFNSNAEPGPEQTGGVEKIVAAGFNDCWALLHPGDPGYTWPLFGEDQMSGPKTPNERIDLIFAGGFLSRKFEVLSAERTGMEMPWASDHAGVVAKVELK